MTKTSDAGSAFVEAVWNGHSWPAKVSQTLLSPVSACFGLGVRIRSLLYSNHVLPVVRAPLPVVSVGNLRVGGSGKTPTVLWLVAKLVEHGVRPMVVCRGYGGRRRRAVLDLRGPMERGAAASIRDLGFVPIDDPASPEWDHVADEAHLLAARGRVPVAISARRIEAARVAALAECDCLVLDDGFQHRRLARDVDIVLVTSRDRKARLLPAGPLREPWSALRRANIVLGSELADVPGEALVSSLRRTAVGIVDDVGAACSVAPMERLRDRDVVAVAGIARPHRFFQMLREAGARVREARTYRDHHPYDLADWQKIRDATRAGEWVITTEKDLVKLRRIARDDADLKALRIEVVPDAEEKVVGSVLGALRKLDASQMSPHDR